MAPAFQRLSAAVAICLGAFASACGEVRPHSPVASAAFEALVSYPSSAAYDPDAGAMLVGSYADGAVQRLAEPGDGPAKVSTRLPHDGRQNVLRIRLDRQRRRIWVMGSDALHVYDSTTSRLLRRVEIDAFAQYSFEHCMPDMAIDRFGTVLVSNAMQPKLWRVDATSYAVTEHPVRIDADQDKDFGFSAMTFAGTDDTLYAASAITGVLWKIDPLLERASKIELTEPIWGACGLSEHRAGPGSQTDRVLYVAGGFRNSVKRVELAGPGSGKGESSSRSDPTGRVARVQTIAQMPVPTDFVSIGRMLLVVSSQLSEHPDFNGEGRPSTPFRIVRLTVP